MMMMAGDIWSMGALSFESPLKELLDSGVYTLEQLLAEDELLQELRGIHPQLIAIFSTPQAVTKLVQYVILPQTTFTSNNLSSPPLPAKEEEENYPQNVSTTTNPRRSWTNLIGKDPENDPLMRHVRFPYMACEIICCEINPIIDMLVDGQATFEPEDSPESDEPSPRNTDTDTTMAQAKNTPEQPPNSRILDVLFSVLYDTPPGELDDYRAGYFDKILTVLFRKRPEDLSNYMNQGGSRGVESLMKAMFSHLYSHSIMQIAQRLMLPPRPHQALSSPNEQDLGAEIMPGDQGLPDENENGALCDWSKSSKALHMLLECLIEPKVQSPQTILDIETLRLDLALNTSEVLITLIQNSLLSSETMLSLTSLETLQRLVQAATTLVELDNGEPYFSPHESLLTCAMNVLESLILQLGGYGAVGTMFVLPENEEELQQQEEEEEADDEQQEEPENQRSTPQGAQSGRETYQVDCSDDDDIDLGAMKVKGNIDIDQSLIANLGSLVAILPNLLDALATLLRHPSTKKWTSPMQYSKTEPQQLLGNSRLRIVRVLESLVLLGDQFIDSKLVESSCLEICLELFWEFPWCSMLHQSVANLLVHVFEGRNARIQMQDYFLVRCNLLGRLMDSFLDTPDMKTALTVLKDGDFQEMSEPSSANEKVVASDDLPVSDDDVEAALDTQEVELLTDDEPAANRIKGFTNVEKISAEALRLESREGSTIGVAAPPQTFRLGYMGHVIIICQALVHACSNDGDHEDPQSSENEEVVPGSASQDGTGEPLLMAQLVACHDLADKWNEFVASTLASETAIQSTPLGGYAGGSSHDPLQSHRPGLVDDGDMGDDGIGPPAPPRGMYGSGDVIDMDDNDLDMAASMMANMNLQRQATDEDFGDAGSLNSADSEKSYNSGETATERTGYVFDDPLGKAGGLGIELGKLTKFGQIDEENSGGCASGRETSDEQESGENDSGSSASTDDEPDDDNLADGKRDVPIMDLFAGNFDFDRNTQDDGDQPRKDEPEWSNFANFDEVEEVFGEFESAKIPRPSAVQETSNHADIEEIFGAGDHTELLIQEDGFQQPLGHDEVKSNAFDESIPPDVEKANDEGLTIVSKSMGQFEAVAATRVPTPDNDPNASTVSQDEAGEQNLATENISSLACTTHDDPYLSS